MEKNICGNCMNYIGKLKCFAFENKIPDEILTGKNNHLKPLLTQKNDIIFKPIK